MFLPSARKYILENPYPRVGKILHYSGTCRITRLWPLDTSQSGTTVPLWAEVRTERDLPENAGVWFWVDGPGWSGSHWVGSKSAAGLRKGQTRWYRFDWTIPSAAAAGTYTYKAQVWRGWTDKASPMSGGQDFIVQTPLSLRKRPCLCRPTQVFRSGVPPMCGMLRITPHGICCG